MKAISVLTAIWMVSGRCCHCDPALFANTAISQVEAIGIIPPQRCTDQACFLGQWLASHYDPCSGTLMRASRMSSSDLCLRTLLL